MSKLVNEKDFAKLMLKMPDKISMLELTQAFMEIQTLEIQILTKQELTMINPKHKKGKKNDKT